MKIDSTPFEQYRQSPNRKTTLPRLIAGSVIVALFWLVVTGAVMFAGVFGYAELAALFGPETLTFDQGGITERFLASPVGVVAALMTFAGIWLGVWIAMRAVHRERLSRLFGNSGRISRVGFAKGLIAVLLTSVLTEIGLYLLVPEIGRGPISLSSWLVFLVPMLFLAFVQTSSEELLFRGYLMRGLAYRFKSPLVWALLPALVFTALHWNANSVLAMNIGVLVSIGAFAALLVVLVYATGNLGAAMGAHLGNNLVGFLLRLARKRPEFLRAVQEPATRQPGLDRAAGDRDRRHEHRRDRSHAAAAPASALAAQGRARSRLCRGFAGPTRNDIGSRYPATWPRRPRGRTLTICRIPLKPAANGIFADNARPVDGGFCIRLPRPRWKPQG